MNDENKTKEQLLNEIAALEKRVAELETAHAEYRRAEVANKHLDGEQHHSKQMLELILDTIPQRVFWKNRNFSYIGCNSSFAKDAGLNDPIEIVGKNDFDLPWKDVAPLFRADDREVMETDSPKLNFEEPQIAPNGRILWVRTNKVPLHDQNGNVIGLLGTYQDITRLKQAEEQLKYERNLLRTVIDNIPDGIYVKDLNCRKTLSNLADEQTMGVQSEADVLGKDDYEFFPRELAEVFIADDRSVLQTGQPIVNQEEYIIDKEGKKHFLLTTKIPFRNEQGQIIGLIGISRNITEHRKIEEALRNEKALLDALMDHIPDSIYFKDRQCRHIRVNRKEMQDLNIDDMNKIIGKTDVDLWGEEFGRMTITNEQHLIESGEPIIGQIECRQVTDGQVWTSTTKVPIRDTAGQIIGLVGITRDISELMKTQQERERLIKELQDALADIKTLSGLVPICANCKKIRDDKGYWMQLEGYLQEHSHAKFSHGVCPDCMQKLYPDFLRKKEDRTST
jgi:two-component system, sensor histidine kinase and response regulator